jgi:hypothetical protein
MNTLVTSAVVTPASTLSLGSSAMSGPKDAALQVLDKWIQAFNQLVIDFLKIR